MNWLGATTGVAAAALALGSLWGSDRSGGAVGPSSHRYLILVEFSQGTRTRLEIVRDGRVERVVSTHAYQKASWAPDGTALAFWKVDSSTLSVASGDGRNPRALLPLLEPDFDWAPHGHRLAVPLDGRIFSVNARTGRRVPVTAPTRVSDYRAPRWSPSGRLIAYVRQDAARAHCVPSRTIGADLVVARADGSGARKLTALYRIRVPADYCAGGYPTIASDPVLSRLELNMSCLVRSPISWAPNEHQIAFMLVGRRHRCTARTIDVATGRLHTVPKLFQEGFAWSPDGRRAAVVGKQGIVITARVDGRYARTLMAGDRVFGWWPDGTLTISRRVEPQGEERGQTEVIDTRDQSGAAGRVVYQTREGETISAVDRGS